MNPLALWFRGATLARVRPRYCLLASVILVCLPAIASAGVFGGFSKDGAYKRGTDQLCAPVDAKGAGPLCKTTLVGEMAKHSFGKGTKQGGRESSVRVRKKGTKLQVLAAEGTKPLVSWDSQQVLGEVGAVYLSSDKRWVAIEYRTRFAGRAVESVVVLGIGLPKDGPASSDGTATALPTAAEAKKNTEPEGFREALKKGMRLIRKRKKAAKAQIAFEAALALVPEHPEVLFHLAVLHHSGKDIPATLKTLQRLATSKHPEVPRWRVEARFELRFKALRGNSDFRFAVGITRVAGDAPSLYERLVAYGGRWEQEAIPCEQPQVNLTLRREKKQRFDLVIRSKCQGGSETTRLDGNWTDKGSATKLGLSFPNLEAADDLLACNIEVCADDSGEDCIRCQVEGDDEFLLRIVRR
ncbi:MAG: hypothetical protein GY811_08875 [Myxococcales bacterium]|nr:hypothetical protein [Myxococcales bacterium]